MRLGGGNGEWGRERREEVVRGHGSPNRGRERKEGRRPNRGEASGPIVRCAGSDCTAGSARAASSAFSGFSIPPQQPPRSSPRCAATGHLHLHVSPRSLQPPRNLTPPLLPSPPLAHCAVPLASYSAACLPACVPPTVTVHRNCTPSIYRARVVAISSSRLSSHRGEVYASTIHSRRRSWASSVVPWFQLKGQRPSETIN